VAAVCAWNFPLLLAVWKVLPAIAVGNTVVLKPGEFTPLTALALARAAAAAGVPAGGAYYEPSLVTGVGADAEIVRTEVFGPVLTVLPFVTDDEAIRQANHTASGLAASVWTRDVFRAQCGAREIRAGCVWINDHIPMVSEMPHGGTKASGFCKDLSRYALEEHTVLTHVMSELTGTARKAWHRTVIRH
jgi:betaine-aldehyde dehydrogenase